MMSSYLCSKSILKNLSAVRVRVRITAADNDAHGLSFEAFAKRIHQRRESGGARRLNDELGDEKRQTHRLADLIVAHKNDLVDELPVERERIRLTLRRAERVGD